jgi:hypothetical protein
MRPSLLALASLLVLFAAPAPLSGQSIQGVWRLYETEVRGGPSPGTRPLQDGYLVFTGRHYSWTLDTSGAPRPPASSTPATDAEVRRGLAGFLGAAGTYEFDGTVVRYIRDVDVNPALMKLPLERRIVLTRDRLEASGENADGSTTINRYRRVE